MFSGGILKGEEIMHPLFGRLIQVVITGGEGYLILYWSPSTNKYYRLEEVGVSEIFN